MAPKTKLVQVLETSVDKLNKAIAWFEECQRKVAEKKVKK